MNKTQAIDLWRELSDREWADDLEDGERIEGPAFDVSLHAIATNDFERSYAVAVSETGCTTLGPEWWKGVFELASDYGVNATIKDGTVVIG